MPTEILEPTEKFAAVQWEDGELVLLDQRLLPDQEIYLRFNTLEDTVQAIRDMVVRGAPAIGIAAAYGAVLAAREKSAAGDDGSGLLQDLERLEQARPTAVNLSWAVAQMRKVIEEHHGSDLGAGMLERARAIHRDDIQANLRIGELGAGLICEPSAVLTHCNAGALATGGYGTALGVIRSAHGRGNIDRVYAGETRPWLQGARLTAWEMVQSGIPVSLIPDSAAAHLMRGGRIRWVVVGADRITACGDAVNKIGTYSLAVNARRHGVKFMVAAPSSTIDPNLESGDQVPIEIRDSDEVLQFSGKAVAALGAEAWNPVFDVTPAELIDAIVTENGVVEAPEGKGVLGLL